MSDLRIRLINQVNAGELAARNRGIKASKANYIAFLDADDEWKPSFLEEVANLLYMYPGCGAYATSYEIIEENKKTYYPCFSGMPRDRACIIPNIFRVLQTGLPFNASSIMISKQVLTQIDGFPVGVKRGGDLITWIKIGLEYPIAYSNSRQSIYHREAINRACNVFDVGFDETERQAYLKNILKNKKLDNVIRKDLTDYYVLALLDSAKEAIVSGKLHHAKKILNAARGNNKYKFKWLLLKMSSAIPVRFLSLYFYLSNLLYKKYHK